MSANRFGSTAGAASEFDSPEALEAWIEDLSIRARMAYALLCIEAACRAWDADSPPLRATLETLWAFVPTQRTDRWEASLDMGALLPYDDFGVDDTDWQDVVAGWGLTGLDDGRAEALVRMLSLATAIGTDNLYSGYESTVTAAPLKTVVNIMQIVDVDLPERGRVSLSGVDEAGGWGTPRPPAFFR